MSLRRQAMAAVRWTTLAMAGRAAIQFAQIVILARLLTPADFGAMAIIASLAAIVQIVADLGLGPALIQAQNPSRAELNSLYWVNVMCGAVMTLIACALAPLLSYFYHDPRLAGMTMIVASSFLVLAFGQQFRVLAQKGLQFGRLAIIELVAAGGGAIVSAVLAIAGAGPYALAFGFALASILNTTLCWILLSEVWRPALRFSWLEARSFVRNGAGVVGVNLLNAINMQADIIVGGRMLGGALGLYSVPRDLCLRIQFLVNPIVTRVALPVIAASQTNAALVKRIYADMLRMTTSTNFPIYGFIAVFGQDIIDLLFDSKWSAAGGVIQIVAVAALIRSINNPIGSLLFALGKFKMSMISAGIVTVTMFPVLAIGATLGLHGLAWANVFYFALTVPALWFYLVRPNTGISIAAYAAQIGPPLLGTLLAAGVAWLTVQPLEAPLARVAVGAAAGGAVYVAVSFLVNRRWLQALRDLFTPAAQLQPSS